MPLHFRDEQLIPLSSVQGDENIRTLNSRLQALELDPPSAVSIDHFVVEGTLLTIYLSNGSSQGPFVLPTAQWRWTGEYVIGITYLPGDIFTESSNVYFVRVMHVAPDPFDANLFTGDGFAYIKILAKAAQRYDIGSFFIDKIAGGLEEPEVLFLHVAAENITIYPLLAHSQAFLRVAATTATISLPIFWNTDTIITMIGVIRFEPGVGLTSDGGQHGTFEIVDEYLPLTIAIGDRLSLTQPYESDATAAGLAVTIATLTASA